MGGLAGCALWGWGAGGGMLLVGVGGGVGGVRGWNGCLNGSLLLGGTVSRGWDNCGCQDFCDLIVGRSRYWALFVGRMWCVVCGHRGRVY